MTSKKYNKHCLAVRVGSTGSMEVKVACAGGERQAAELFRKLCQLFAELPDEVVESEFKSTSALHLPGVKP